MEPASPPVKHTAQVSRPGLGRSKTSYLFGNCHRESPRKKLDSGLHTTKPNSTTTCSKSGWPRAAHTGLRCLLSSLPTRAPIILILG